MFTKVNEGGGVSDEELILCSMTGSGQLL